MAKVIRLTEALREEARRDFERFLTTGKCQNGEFKFSKRFNGADGKKAKIILEPKAWEKIFLLLHHFNTEVSWRGLCRRGEGPGTYVVSDVLVFPQKVGDSTANTNDVEDAKWICSQPPEIKRQLRFHGHSHVNMGAFSSGTDTSYQQEILSQLLEDDFYVFMIWNKRLDFWSTIFDMRDNVQYEDADITCVLRGSDWDPKSFLEDADKLCVKTTSTYAAQTHVTPSCPGYSYHGATAKAAATPSSPVVVSKKSGKKKKGGQIPLPPAQDVEEDDGFDDETAAWYADLRASHMYNYTGLDD